MAPLRDKLFVICLIVLTALAIAAVPRIHAESPASVDSGEAANTLDNAPGGDSVKR